MNVEVLQGSSRKLAISMKLGERSEGSQRLVVDFAARLANASQQCLSRGTKGSVLPTIILLARVALSSLQDPLQRIVGDSPVLVEMRYEAI